MKYPDLKGIVGTSSKDAIGVAKAIEEMGLQGKKFTAGTALPNESMQFLKSGTLSSGALWDPKDAGYALAELAVKILRGEKIENGLNLKKKGYESMQFAEGSDKVLLGAGWVVITKENVDSFGF